MLNHSAFADNICIGQFTCSAIGGSGGGAGDTGYIGPGGSCFASDHSSMEIDVVVVQVVTNLVLVVGITV
jgi:hypothetical protein